jgi:hypothetical protein
MAVRGLEWRVFFHKDTDRDDVLNRAMALYVYAGASPTAAGPGVFH